MWRWWWWWCLLLAASTVANARPRTAPAPVPAEFTDVVLVGNDRGFFCSGVVVAPTRVLTAAHCAPATRIAVGDSLTAAIAYQVATVTAHPTEDIAVLTLTRPITTRPHPLREGHEPPTASLAIVGFGVEDPIRVSGFGTKRIRLATAEDWGCDRRRARDLGCRTATELLLRGTRDNDTCFGDSGGGVFERAGTRWRLIAITSRSTTPKRAVCGEGGVYVRVDAVRTWLETNGGDL